MQLTALGLSCAPGGPSFHPARLLVNAIAEVEDTEEALS